MKERTEVYLDFLRYALHDDAPEPQSVSQIDWADLLKFAQQQAIVGVMYHGLNKLPPDGPNRPNRYEVAAWVANSGAVRAENQRVNRDSSRITAYLYNKKHVRACTLKGQANALMYPDPYMRTPGDIDLWPDVSTRRIIAVAREMEPEAEIGYHHINLEKTVETTVEMHYVPSFMGNLFYEYRLRRYFRRVREQQFVQLATLPGDAGKIIVPTDGFSRIFQISHVMHHFFFEGIGLRQLIDYYYLLRRGFSEEEREHDVKLLRHLNMYKFASGMMWLMAHVFGLESRYLLCEPNEKVGRLLLREILLSGNFGHHDERYHFGGKNIYSQYILETYRNLHFALTFPSETLWGRPVSRWWHAVYKAYLRWRQGRELSKRQTI